jgi:hypothetical protein
MVVLEARPFDAQRVTLLTLRQQFASHRALNTRDIACWSGCGLASDCDMYPMCQCGIMQGQVSLQNWMVGVHAQLLPASPWQGWNKNLCARFSPYHIQTARCNCWKWPFLTGSKRGFVCQQAHVSLVLPHHSYEVTPCPYPNISTVFKILSAS